MNTTTNRRGFLALAASSPLAALAGPARPGVSTVDRATGDRLDALWEAARAAWGVCLRRHREEEAEVDRAFDMPDGEDRDSAFDRIRDTLLPVKRAARHRLWAARVELIDAIREASGGRGLTMDDWHCRERPVAWVRAGGRIYAVTAEYDLDFYPDEEPGIGEVVVIDLDEIGGVL